MKRKSVLLLDDERGRLLVVRHRVRGTYRLPGGDQEENESAFLAMLRELTEELPYLTVVGLHIWDEVKVPEYLVSLYHAKAWRGSLRTGAEISEARFVSEPKLLRLSANSRSILCAKKVKQFRSLLAA